MSALDEIVREWEGEKVRIWASLGDGLPRLVAEMSRKEYMEGKEIHRTPVLAWGQAWEPR